MIHDPTYPPSTPEMEEVTVVIPSKGRPEKLGSVLTSMKDQSMTPHEVIVAGEGKMTKRIAQTFSSVKLVDGGGGIGAARNKAIEKSSGDILLFTDDDSIPPKNWVESMVWTLQQDEVVTCGGMNYPHPDLRDGLLARGDVARLRMNQEYEGLTIGGYELSTFGASNVGYRAEALGSVRFNEDVPRCDDGEVQRKVLEKGGKNAYVPVPTWHFREYQVDYIGLVFHPPHRGGRSVIGSVMWLLLSPMFLITTYLRVGNWKDSAGWILTEMIRRFGILWGVFR